MTYYEVIQNALNILYHKEEYAYFYGAKGQRLDDATMDALIRCEPAHFAQYTERQMKLIRDYSRGKIGLDCSGFINACTGQENYSTGYYTETLNKTTPALGTEGNLLYTTWGGKGRHVGLDIGYGFFLHFPKEGHSCEIGRIKETAWENSGQIRDVDYTGAKN